jgi:predicted nucleic acid-binding protein
MSGFLLDTNILSEIRKENRCDTGVRAWIESTDAEQMFISVLALGEIRQGIERIRRRDQSQVRALEKWLHRLRTEFAERILPVDERVTDQWGCLGLQQPVPALDAFLAATALVHELAVVSRDEDGFRNTGVQLINPFTKVKPIGT